MSETIKNQFDGKITKTLFEKKLFEVANGRKLSKRVCNENGDILTLYYMNEGHAGTWMNGNGWIYSNERIENNIKEIEFITRELENY